MASKSEFTLPNLIPYNDKGKWGYCKPIRHNENLKNPYKKNLEIVIDCIYDSAKPFEDGLALVELRDKYFYITEEGEIYKNIKYDSIYPYSEGLAAVVLNNKVGFINKRKELTIPFEYLYKDKNGHNFNDFIFKDGIVKVRKLVHNEIVYGFIDKNGNTIIPFDYSYLRDFDNGVTFADDSNRVVLEWYGRIELSESEKISFIKDFVKETFLINKKNERFHFHGKESSEHFFIFKDDFAIVSIEQNYFKLFSFINNRGERIHAFYNKIRPFNEGYAYVSISKFDYSFPMNDEVRIKHANFVDKFGFEISNIRFEYASDFHEGFATIRLDKKWGLLNTKGEIALPCISEEFINRYNEICIVKINGKYGLTNISGLAITQYIYDEIKSIEESIAIVRINDKWGFVNTNGAIITDCIFDNVGSVRDGKFVLFENGFIVLEINGKFGYLTINGISSECIYDKVEIIFEDLIAIGFNYTNDYGHLRIKFGFFNRDGEQLTEFYFSNYRVLSNDLIAIEENKSKNDFLLKWGIMSIDGNVLVDCIYDRVKSFNKDIGCIVKFNRKYGIIDIFGNVKIDFIFEEITFLGNKEYLEVNVQSGKWYEKKIFHLIENKILDYIPDNVVKKIIDKSSFDYQAAPEFENNIALVRSNKQYGYIDIFGNEYFKHQTDNSDSFYERPYANPMDAFDDYEQYVDWYENQ